MELNPGFLENIHYLGGTVLGSSRGHQDPDVMVDTLEREKIDILFCVGGDGTQRGAAAIAQAVTRRRLSKAIVGIPKTIDNDIEFVFTSFGYNTALEKAEEVLRGATSRPAGAPNGIGLVKLMGRNAGFIAAGAALASQDANFVLIPEVPFRLDGRRRLTGRARSGGSWARDMRSSSWRRGPVRTCSTGTRAAEMPPETSSSRISGCS